MLRARTTAWRQRRVGVRARRWRSSESTTHSVGTEAVGAREESSPMAAGAQATFSSRLPVSPVRGSSAEGLEAGTDLAASHRCALAAGIATASSRFSCPSRLARAAVTDVDLAGGELVAAPRLAAISGLRWRARGDGPGSSVWTNSLAFEGRNQDCQGESWLGDEAVDRAHRRAHSEALSSLSWASSRIFAFGDFLRHERDDRARVLGLGRASG